MNRRLYHIIATLFLLTIFLQAPHAYAQEVDIDTAAEVYATGRFDTGWQQEMEPLQPLSLPDSVLRKIKSDDNYWYANYRPKPLKKEAPTVRKDITEQDWFHNLVWFLVIVAFIVALVWYLLSSDIRLFRRTPVIVEGEEEAVEDIFEIDYDHNIHQAVAEGNFRLATRLYYLRTLRELSDKGMIDYHPEKTNSEYLQQLSGTRHYRSFFRLTRDFEYTWYGKFDLSPAQFDLVQKDFSLFKSELA